jgi:hypothetical protein
VVYNSPGAMNVSILPEADASKVSVEHCVDKKEVTNTKISLHKTIRQPIPLRVLYLIVKLVDFWRKPKLIECSQICTSTFKYQNASA